MRRPFIAFLLVVSIFCWLTDLFNFIYYLFNVTSAHKNTYSYLISGFIVLTGIYWLTTRISPNGRLQTVKDFFQTNRKKEWLLLLLATMPFTLLGLFRSIYPDQNYDTFHFELYLQEYNLAENKTNFAAGGKGTYYFRLPATMFALFRHILGFRLGALLNTFLLVTTVVCAYDFIKKFLSAYAKPIPLSLVVPVALAFFTVFSDHTLSTIGSYKPDLMGIPFLLELLYLVFFPNNNYSKKTNYFLFFLFASLTLTYKLTYLPYVGILSAIYFIKNYKQLHPAALLGIPFVILLFPAFYMVYNVIETGSPLFPYFNKLFRSPFYPPENFKDGRWGPRTPLETVFYPFVTLLDNFRCDEWALYSFRLLFGYLTAGGIAIAYVLNLKKNKFNTNLRYLFYLAILSLAFDFSLIISTGYYRYGMIVEVMYGLVIGLLVIYLPKKIPALLVLFAIVFQSYDTFKNRYVKHINLSWNDYPDLMKNSVRRRNNMHLMLNDYGRIIDSGNILPKVDAFIGINPYMNDGVAKLLNPKIPIYDLGPGHRVPDSTLNFENRFIKPQSATKNFFVVANVPAMNEGIVKTINDFGYEVSEIHEVFPDFMRYGEPVFLLRIKYVDTSKYTIKSTIHFFNKDTIQSTFTYQSTGKMKVFFREAPYTFDWTKNAYNLYMNDRKYYISNTPNISKTYLVEGNSVNMRTSEPITYLIMIQEFFEKK